MDLEWERLEARLAHRRDEGRALRVWWRDDDATAWTPELARLLAFAESCAMPIALATVPGTLDPGLLRLLADAHPLVMVLQHGNRHRNEARDGERAVECGGFRPTEAILADLHRGRHRLAEAFGERFLPVMVPPWNRIEERIAAALPGAGYVGLSGFGSAGERREDGFTIANSHLDVLRWKGGARFAGEGKLLAAMDEWLDDPAAGGDAPFGLLTHHLDHDDATWQFLERLLPMLRRHTQPVSAASVFASGSRGD